MDLTWKHVKWELAFEGRKALIFDLSCMKPILIFALTVTTKDAYDGGNECSKLMIHLSIRDIWKLGAVWRINASLSEGPIFYFYVESPSSHFMHP
jgi:hypothetical protein